MKALEVRLRFGPDDERVVGRLAWRDRRVYFEYADAFLASGLHLSPWKLPSEPGLHEHRDRAFGPLPGVFDDSLPDGWGLLLMDRYLRAEGLDPRSFTSLDRLEFLGTRTMGALTYHPPASISEGAAALDLHRMAEASREILSGSTSEVLAELLRAGGSPAGARPKVVVGVRGDQLLSGEDDLPEGYEHWLIKFPGPTDPRDIGALELAYMRMADAAGVSIPEARLFQTEDGARYFGVRRFDRAPGNRRRHVHSLGGLIHADFRVPGCDYDHLLRVTRSLTRNHEEVVEAFRRMVFNVLAHNRDDHVKNFAFVMDDEGEWTSSPAFDLVYAIGPGGEHQMTVHGEGREPSRQDCVALADAHGVAGREADEVMEEVAAAVADWERIARECGCEEESLARIAAAHRSL